MPLPENPLPDFDRPPVVEVVCGVRFREIQSLLAPHLGLLWQKYRPEFSRCEEHPLFAAPIESFNGDVKLELKIQNKPPLPRIWFVHGAEDAVIQIQRDCFLHNWRKASDTDQYPRFAKVIQQFREHLDRFTGFLEEHKLEQLQPRQYELTYINHIPQGDGWEKMEDVANIFPDFTWKADEDRFLPIPDGADWRTSFLLPDKAGRLHATIRKARRARDDQSLFLFELCARGFPKAQDKNAQWEWFELAHQWIVRGFADLTSGKIQKERWKRTT